MSGRYEVGLKGSFRNERRATSVNGSDKGQGPALEKREVIMDLVSWVHNSHDCIVSKEFKRWASRLGNRSGRLGWH